MKNFKLTRKIAWWFFIIGIILTIFFSLLIWPIYFESPVLIFLLIISALLSVISVSVLILDFFKGVGELPERIQLSVDQVKNTHAHLTAGLTYDLSNHLTDFLGEYLGTPQKMIPFGGRRREFKDLWAWLEDDNRTPYFLLAAPAGRGKSALLTRWISDVIIKGNWRVVYLPISIRFNTSSPTPYFKFLANRLEQAFGDPITRDINASVEIWKNICLKYFDAKNTHSKAKVLLVIDGLDESSDQDWRIWQGLLSQAGIGIPALISARYIETDQDPTGWQNRLGLNNKIMIKELDFLKEDAIPEILQSMGNPLKSFRNVKSIQNELHRLTQGDPLLLGLYVATLHDLLKPENEKPLDENEFLVLLKTLKPDFAGFFEYWWDDQRKSWQEQGKDARKLQIEMLELLQVLAISKGPLSGVDLENLLSKFNMDINKIRGLVQEAPRIILGKTSSGYTLAHPRFKDYFLGDDQITPTKKRDLLKRYIEYGQKTLRQLKSGSLSPHKTSHYLLQHYRYHLREGYEQETVKVPQIYELRNMFWMKAHESLTGSFSSYIEDIELVWNVAVTQESSGIPWQIWCALCQSSIISVSNRISPELIKAFLSIEVVGGKTFFSMNQALSYAELFQENKKKADVFLSILEMTESHAERERLKLNTLETIQNLSVHEQVKRFLELYEIFPEDYTLVNDALNTACQIEDFEMRTRALAEVSSRLPPEQAQIVLDEALNTVRQIEDQNWRARALAEVTSRLPPEQALNTAHQIEDQNWRARALAEVTSRLPPEQALNTAHQIEDQNWRARALAEVANRLPPEQAQIVLDEALNTANNINQVGSRAEVMAEVASCLPSEQAEIVLDEALNTACQIKDQFLKANALVKVAIQLPREKAQVVLDKALNTARQIEDKYFRDIALLEVARHLPTEQALNTAHQIDNTDIRARILVEVASLLPPEQAQITLDEVFNTARQIDDTAVQARALAEVASRLSPEQALNTARQIENRYLRAGALAEVASRLTSEQMQIALDEALNAARQIEDAGRRAHVLAEVARLLPPEQALNTACQIEDRYWRARALAEVARRLTPEQMQIALDEALNTARQIDDTESRAITLAEVARRLTPEQSKIVFDEALNTVREIDDTEGQAFALAEVARHLPTDQSQIVLDEALNTARQLGIRILRDNHLERMTNHLPPELALNIACEIDDTESRARVLAEISKFLPPEQALNTAHQIEVQYWRGHALSDVTRHLPTEQALYTARQIEDLYWRVHALADVTRRLPPDQSQIVLDEALNTAREIEDTESRALTLAEVARHLPSEQAQVILDEALNTAREIDDTERQAFALSKVARHLPPDQSQIVLDEALNIANQIEYLSRRTSVVFEMAKQIISEGTSVNVGLYKKILLLYFNSFLKPSLYQHQIKQTLINSLWDDYEKELGTSTSQTLETILNKYKSRNRAELMESLIIIFPVLARKFQPDIMVQIAAAIQEVGEWWP